MAGPSKINNSSNIPLVNPSLDMLVFLANTSDGLGKVSTLQQILNLFATGSNAPARSYTDVPAMLANVDIPVLYFAFVSDAGDDPDAGAGWGLYLYLGGARTDLASYVLIMYQAFSGGGSGVDHWRGNHDISTDNYPLTGGSGTAGAIMAGNQWGGINSGDIDINGLGVTTVYQGALFIALVNSPGTTPANWKVIQ